MRPLSLAATPLAALLGACLVLLCGAGPPASNDTSRGLDDMRRAVAELSKDRKELLDEFDMMRKRHETELAELGKRIDTLTNDLATANKRIEGVDKDHDKTKKVAEEITKKVQFLFVTPFDTRINMGANQIRFQFDGNVVIYDKANKAIWASNTVRK